MSIKKSVLILMIVFLLVPSLCLAKQGFSIEIDNVETKPVAEYLLKDLVGKGFQILSTSDYQVAVRKDVDNFWEQVFLGSRFNTVPELRAYFNLIQSGNKTCITSEVKIVTNPNSGFERYTNVTNNSWQVYLNNVKQYFNGYVGYGIDWDSKKKDEALKVSFIYPGGPADKAELKVGDLITKVKGTPVNDLSMKKIEELFKTGDIGTTIEISIKIPLKEKNVMMTKELIPPMYKKPNLSPAVTNKPVFGFKNGEPDLEGNMPIIAITPGSSADRAGLKVGEKILRINGILVSQYTPDTFSAAFSGGEGAKVELTVTVNGEQQEKTVTLIKTYIIQKNEL